MSEEKANKRNPRRRMGLGLLSVSMLAGLNWCHPPLPDLRHDHLRGDGRMAMVEVESPSPSAVKS